MTKTIGVLGGMGPYASAAFYKMVLDLTQASKDWDHLHLVIDSNPHIPSRSRHHIYNEASPLPKMIECCNRLSKYPVDAIAIPCNSAQVWIQELQSAIGIPILNIMESSTDAIVRSFSKIEQVCVLGSRVVYDKQSYKKYIEEAGIRYHRHSETTQCMVERLIEMIKIQDNLDNVAERTIEIIKNIINGDEKTGVILGCTEFACVYSRINSCCNMQVVDSTTEYARSLIAYSGGKCK